MSNTAQSRASYSHKMSKQIARCRKGPSTQSDAGAPTQPAIALSRGPGVARYRKARNDTATGYSVTTPPSVGSPQFGAALTNCNL